MTGKFKKMLVIALVLSALAVQAAFADVSYYGRIWPQKPQVRPGEKAQLKIRLESYGNRKASLMLDYTLSIYRLDWEKLSLKDVEQDKHFTLVSTEKKNALLKGTRGRWLSSDEICDVETKEPGMYRAVINFKKQKAEVLFSVTEIGAVIKTTTGGVNLFTADTESGEPQKDLPVYLIMPGKSLTQMGKTDENGLFSIEYDKMPIPEKELSDAGILVVKGKDYLLGEISKPWEGPRFKAYIYTDRPVYRPGQKVYFKGVLRYDEMGSLNPINDEKVKVEIKDSKGTKLLDQEMDTGKYSSIDGSITLGEEPPLGRYEIRVYYKGKTGTGSFSVEEYRKPEFMVNIEPEEKFITGGAEGRFKGEVKYYFGAPVAGAPYTYTVTKRQYYPYFYRYWWQEYIPYYSSVKTVATGNGTTDDKGCFSLNFKTERDINDCTYSVSARVTDESRRVIDGAGSLIATVGQYNLQLKADRYFYKPQDQVSVKVTARDYQGNPVSADVKMSVSKASWERGKRISQDSFYQKTITTGKDGEGIFTFVPDRTGYFTVNASSQDQGGNIIMASTSFYSAESGGDWYKPSGMDMKPDKAFYNYDEDVNIMVSNTAGPARALLSVEGDEIYLMEIIDLKAPVDVIKLKAATNYAPNVNVTLSFWKDGKVYRTSCSIVVPATDKLIDLKISRDKKTYGPRQTANMTIKATEKDGKPVSCEVCVGVADESVYAVAEDKTPDIQKFYWASRYVRVRTVDSYVQHFTTYPESEDMVPMAAPTTGAARMKNGAKGDGDDGMAEPEFVREFFPDTCYFNPSIITDHRGEASFSVPLPDSLTTWRLTARAATVMSEVGQAVDKFIVKKDLLVRLILPRFLTEGDTSEVSAIVHNYLDEETESRVSIKVQGAKLLEPETTKVKIPRNGKVKVQWKVKAEKSGQAKFTVTALTKKESDAMALTIPINPRGVKIVKARAESGEDQFVMSLDLPKDVPMHSAGMEIVLSPSLAGTLIPAIEYLAGYPYGCTEQTMSRFIPNAVVQASLKEFNIRNPKLEEELPKMMKKGFEKLYDYHHSDGGWGWWKNDKSHPYMTAYVVYGLSLAKKSGFTVDENRLNRGVKWLTDNYSSEKEPDTRAYMLFALSQSGNHKKEWLKNLFDVHHKLGNYSKAILAISLWEADEKSSASAVLHSLEKSAVVQNTQAFWKSGDDRSWTDNRVETTAYAVKAFILIDPKNPLLEKAVRYLSASRRGKSWYSTKDTAAAVLALIDYVKLTGETKAEFTATAVLNGQEVKKVSFTSKDIATGGLTVKIPGGDLNRGENRVLISKKGPGRIYATARITYYTSQPFIKAANNGIKVRRQYFRVVKDDKADENAAKRKGRYPLDYQDELKPGEKMVPVDISEPVEMTTQDEVIVKITIEGDADSEYMMVEDFKPAGLEAVEKKISGYWSWWYAQREYRDEKVAFFATRFQKGNRILTYRMRAETPGTFRALPAQASLMYVPDVGGYSDEAEFVILP